jgi:hypothetical protein
MTRLLLTAAMVLALCAGVAQAAPPWSAPQSVSSPALFIEDPDVVIAADGRAVATWLAVGPPVAGGATPRPSPRLAVSQPGAAAFGPEGSAPRFVTPLIAYGLDRLVGLDTKRRSRGRISLRARFGNSQGAFGPPRTISTYTEDGGQPSLAGPNGSLAAWIARTPSGRRIVRAAVKSRGRFGRPFTLRGRGRANDVVAGAALGVMWVAWERAGVVEARVKLSSRRGWSGVQRLGRAAKASTTFAATGSGRRGYVAWIAQGAESAFVRAAILPVAGSRFRKAGTLSQACDQTGCRNDIRHEPPAEGHRLRLVPIPDRDALLAWSDWDGVQWRVNAARTIGVERTDFVSIPVSPFGQSSVLGDVAVAPSGTPVPAGTVMLAWSKLDAVGELGDRVQTAIWHPDGPLALPENVSDLDRARLPAVAFDFKGVRWTSLWSQRIGPETPGAPAANVTTFARAATRPG